MKITISEIEEIRKIPVIFILGKERSGTSLLQNLLDAHPNIIAPPEAKFVALLAPRFSHIKNWAEKDIREFANLLYIDPMFADFWHLDKKQLTENLLLAKDTASYELLCKIVYYHMRKGKGKILLISDKNPPYILHIKTLRKVFPEAKFIHIIREPRDNVYSQMKAFHKKNAFFSATQWLSYNKIVEKNKRREPEKYHTIIYEKMVTETEDVMKGACGFLNVSYDEGMIKNVFPEWLNAHIERKGNVNMEKMAHNGLLSPINSSNIGKWKNKMSEYDQTATEIITADFARKTYGYDIHINPTDKIKIPRSKIVKETCFYYMWQTFARLRYKSLRFNLMYNKRKQKKWGGKMPIWEYF